MRRMPSGPFINSGSRCNISRYASEARCTTSAKLFARRDVWAAVSESRRAPSLMRAILSGMLIVAFVGRDDCLQGNNERGDIVLDSIPDSLWNDLKVVVQQAMAHSNHL